MCRCAKMTSNFGTDDLIVQITAPQVISVRQSIISFLYRPVSFFINIVTINSSTQVALLRHRCQKEVGESQLRQMNPPKSVFALHCAGGGGAGRGGRWGRRGRGGRRAGPAAAAGGARGRHAGRARPHGQGRALHHRLGAFLRLPTIQFQDTV